MRGMYREIVMLRSPKNKRTTGVFLIHRMSLHGNNFLLSLSYDQTVVTNYLYANSDFLALEHGVFSHYLTSSMEFDLTALRHLLQLRVYLLRSSCCTRL